MLLQRQYCSSFRLQTPYRHRVLTCCSRASTVLPSDSRQTQGVDMLLQSQYCSSFRQAFVKTFAQCLSFTFTCKCPNSPKMTFGNSYREVLVPFCSSDSCGRPGAATLTRLPGVWCFLQLIHEAGFGIKHCVKKQCGLKGLCFRGHTAPDLRLSRVRTGVAAMGQDCNNQLDMARRG
jgi:hypothetical protein